MGWIDCKDRLPDKNGEYMIQETITGLVRPMPYTVEGGWNTRLYDDGENTYYNKIDGILFARWLEAETPPPVAEALLSIARAKDYEGEW